MKAALPSSLCALDCKVFPSTLSCYRAKVRSNTKTVCERASQTIKIYCSQKEGCWPDWSTSPGSWVLPSSHSLSQETPCSLTSSSGCNQHYWMVGAFVWASLYPHQLSDLTEWMFVQCFTVYAYFYLDHITSFSQENPGLITALSAECWLGPSIAVARLYASHLLVATAPRGKCAAVASLLRPESWSRGWEVAEGHPVSDRTGIYSQGGRLQSPCPWWHVKLANTLHHAQLGEYISFSIYTCHLIRLSQQSIIPLDWKGAVKWFLWLLTAAEQDPYQVF